ncbi:MAG: hypothetical protein FJY86_04140 [Candidatus Diapherotrites archaeon]|uniref:Lipoprotein n=1 Tax=Candidatus Iainarchaeum sp. TaxID=3101447 RepID=A0A8T4C7Q6_9ARCH|nr:hypothetical protein [Candidatus Diapherotrites archaeon]
MERIRGANQGFIAGGNRMTRLIMAGALALLFLSGCIQYQSTQGTLETPISTAVPSNNPPVGIQNPSITEESPAPQPPLAEPADDEFNDGLEDAIQDLEDAYS